MAEDMKNVIDRNDYEEALLAILSSRRMPEDIREALEDYHENDIAQALQLLPKEDRFRIYEILGPETVAGLFPYMDDVGQYIEELSPVAAADLLELMDADEAVDILNQLDDEKRAEIERRIDKDSMEDISLIQSYDEDEIGSRMTTNFIVIHHDITIKQAMRELVSQAAENDNISTLYVINDDEKFYGAIDLKDLIIARKDDQLEDVIMTSYPFVYDTEHVDECIEELKDYSEDSIPVLNAFGTLLGVITSQELVDVIDDEMGEDYAKLAGLTDEEDLNEPLKESIKKRLPWLVLLLVLGLGVSSIIGSFEAVVAALPLVVCFQSTILDTAGNTGVQSLAVTIRVLVDDELKLKQKVHLLFKEMRVGLTDGVILGLIACPVIGIYIALVKGKALFEALAISGCVSVSLILTMMFASMLGTLIPMGFHKIGVDPAVASGPLITTVIDMIALVTYYGLCWLLLINGLHIT